MHPIDSCSDKALERLGKLIKLIFISDHPGEVSAAVGKVRSLLASEKLDAHWLADQLTARGLRQPNVQAGDKSAPSGGASTDANSYQHATANSLRVSLISTNPCRPSNRNKRVAA